MRNFICDVQVKNLLFNARHLATINDLMGSIRTLNHIFKLFSHENPSLNSPPEVNLYYADIAEQAGMQLNTFHACITFLNQVNSDERLSKYNKFEIAHLLFKCRWILSRLSSFSESDSFLRAKSICVDSSYLRNDKIRKSIRKIFPIDGGTALEVDKFMIENS